VSVLLTILVFAGCLALVWLARFPVIAFIFAVFFAQLCEPIVGRFGSWLKVSRGKAIAVTYTAFVAGLLIFGLTVGPAIAHQAERLATTLPHLMEDLRSGEIARQVGARQGWSAETQVGVQRFLVRNQSYIAHYANDVTGRLEQLGANLPWILLVPVLAVFFQKDRARLRSSLIESITSSRTRLFLDGLIDDLDTMLAAYIRAQLLLSLFAFMAYVVFLWIMGFPYPLAVAAIGGVLEFIPFIGALLTLGILLGIAFLTSYPHWIALICFWGVWRFVQDYVNSPRVMSAGLDLHPLLAILAVLIGGEVAGVLGVFLSIPTVAALRIFWVNWARRHGVRNAA
jgi:predicted PurR-regulated permease PerM